MTIENPKIQGIYEMTFYQYRHVVE